MRAVNLIPSDDRAGSSIGAGRSGGGAYVVLGVVAGLAILAVLYGIAKHQASDRRAEAASLTARAQRAESEASQLAPYTSFMALREQRMNAVSELIDARFDWAHAFGEIGRVLPDDVSVSSLEGSVGSGASASGSSAPAPAKAPAAGAPAPAAAGAAAATVSSATPPGSIPTFTLTGCATTQQEVARTLQRLRLIDGVSEVTLQSSTKSGSAGGGGGGAGCEGSYPAFTVQIAFAALPSSSEIASTTKLTSATGVPR